MVTAKDLKKTELKVFENRIRRMAERQGLRLAKSRRRDPRALDFGKYCLVDHVGRHVFGADIGHMDATLDRIAAYLEGE